MSCPFVPSGLSWVNPSVSGLGISTYSGNVQIDGVFTIDANFTLDGAQLAMNSGAVVTVQSGITLRIINGSILTNIQQVWQGIDLEPGAILEVEDSEICGAETAIEANNLFSATAADISVMNSGLRFNHTGMDVSRYSAGAYPAFVVGTHFEGGPLPGGAATANSYQGIHAFRVDGGTGLTIGDVNTAWAANRFTDMELGIDVQSSSLQAFNNEFENIQPNTLAGNGIAIRALPNPAGPNVLAVGTAADRANTMTDCRIGVWSDNMLEVNVSDNTMSAPVGPFEQGIALYRTQDIVIVGENTITGFTDIGVFMDQHPGAPSTGTDASINNNVITGTFNTSQGVFVDEFIGGLAIRDNRDITQVHRGITVQNATPAASTAISVDNNTVVFSYPGPAVTTDPAVGILAVSVFQPTIDNNEITGNCDYPFGGICTTGTPNNAQIRGIQLVFTDLAQVFKNTVRDCGGGLFVLRTNNEGNAICNHFDNCFSGVVWSNMAADEFGFTIAGVNRVYGLITPTTSADNQWTLTAVPGFEPIRSFAINGSPAGTIDWYYRAAASFDFPVGTNLNDGIGLTVSSLSAVIGNNSNICNILPVIGGGGGESSSISGFESLNADRSVRFQAMANQAIDSLSETDYAYLQGAWLASSTQTLVQGLVARTNIPVLEPRQRKLSHLSADSTSSWLASLVPVNREEELMLELLSMRHALTWDSTRDAWSTEQHSRLREVSRLPLSQAGRAASFASSLLNVAWIPHDWSGDVLSERNAPAAIQHQVQVHPNPASDRIRIASEGPMTHVQILNATGKVLWEERSPASGTLDVDCSSWPVGLFWVKVSLAGRAHSVKTITIQR